MSIPSINGFQPLLQSVQTPLAETAAKPETKGFPDRI